MTIYDKSVAQIIKDYVRERASQETFSAAEILAHFRAHYPKLKPSGIKANLDMLSTNFRSRIHYRPKRGTDDLFFRIQPGQYRRFMSDRDPPPIHSGNGSPSLRESPQAAIATPETEGDEDPQDDTQESGEFAYEHHLRDFLVRNLHTIEPGLTLYEEEGARGVEFPLRQRRVDILALDRDGSYVVIELKVSKGHDRVVGQLLTYMGWVRADIAEGKPVRGAIVAREISDEIRTAIKETRADISVFEYELSFKVNRVADPSG